jgi:hypothetical protein
LVETLDLFSHRLDAWITGLAHKRLQECLAEPGKAPPIGVYGWLEDPGSVGETRAQAEFIQAPSVKQAITSAILRNASIHNGTADNSGAFQINLSSEQVRKGLWYMEGLRQGHLPGELLGYRLERMIHEEAARSQEQDGDPDKIIRETDVFDLRDEFPLSLRDFADQGTPPSSLLTVIDGEKFLSKSQDEKYKKFKSIKARLNQIKDAAADIALSEVIHADDNVARRGGWLDFLEGDSLPPKEEFVSSIRTGDIHGTKIFLVVNTPETLEIDETITNPRVIADPLLTSFCETLMPDFGLKEVVANLSAKDGSKTRQITFQVQELNMEPIDLILGGLEEFMLRLRYYLLSLWKSTDLNDPTSIQPFHILGEFPDYANTDELLNEMRVTIVPPDSAQDSANVFGYIKKARDIRELLHRNRSKNSMGTVHPEDLPIIDQSQQENVDYQASIALFSQRLTKIGELLIDLISSAVGITSELKRRHLILLELRHARNRVETIKDQLLTADGGENGAESINRLKDTLTNLSDTDQDFKSLAESSSIWDQIDLVETGGEQVTDHLDTLAVIFADLESRYEPYLESAARTLVAGSGPLLLDISQFGLEKALTLLPDEPTVMASQKIVKLFEQLLVALIDKLNLALPDAHPIKDILQALKVVYLYGSEVNQILLQHRSNPNGLETQLRNQLPLTLSQSQYISSFSFSNFGYFDPLINSMTAELISAFATSSLTDDIEQSSAAPNAITAELISRLQALTDKEAMTILAPYLMVKEDSYRPEWELDFSQLSKLNGPTYIQEYEEVRPAVSNLYKIFDFGSELSIFEDKYFQRVDPLSPAVVKEGNTDFLYFTLGAGSELKTKYLTVLLVDQWQEGIPNPEQSETTGIALRYPTPPAEAPNAIIVAVPPHRSKSENWTTSILANTLLETIELMQVRMVSSEVVKNYLIKLPALLFPPNKSGGPLFPSKERLLHDFDVGATGGYVLASQLSPKQLSNIRPTSIRSEAPNLEDSNEFE